MGSRQKIESMLSIQTQQLSNIYSLRYIKTDFSISEIELIIGTKDFFLWLKGLPRPLHMIFKLKRNKSQITVDYEYMSRIMLPIFKAKGSPVKNLKFHKDQNQTNNIQRKNCMSIKLILYRLS